MSIFRKTPEVPKGTYKITLDKTGSYVVSKYTWSYWDSVFYWHYVKSFSKEEEAVKYCKEAKARTEAAEAYQPRYF